jgi:methionyl-tRNA formyltransferase
MTREDAVMRIVMMGTGTFAEPTLEALLAGPHQLVGLVTQPDRSAGQERGSTRQVGKGMKQIVAEHNIPVFQPESINTPEGGAGLQSMKPDLLVVAAYGQILSKDVLATAPQGGINVHASLLPKYRGAAPIAWAIYHGEKQTGVTIIYMSVKLDAGDMLLQEAVDISPDETAGELEARLAPLGARLATQAIEQILTGKAKGVKQDMTLVTKAPKLKKEDGLIDWSRGAEQVCNQIRAMQPWPTAYTFFHRASGDVQRLIVTRARTLISTGGPWEYQAPGTVLGGQTLVAIAGWPGSGGNRGKVEILELQPSGKKRMSAAEFLRGHPIREGDHFGPEKS